MRAHLPVLMFLIPFVAAISMPVLGLKHRSLCRPIALVAVSGMSVMSLAVYVAVLVGGEIRYAFSGWVPPIGIEWVADGLSGIMMVTLSLLSLVALIYAGPITPKGLGARVVPYYTLILLLVSSLSGIVMAADLFNLFVFLECAALCSYALIGSAGGPALLSAFRYLILGTLGASLYLLGVGYFYAATGTLNMADLGEQLPGLLKSKAVISGLLFIYIGLAIKMALVPLHGWLPDAYTHAPEAISPLLAAIVTKVSLYAFVRITFWVIGTGGVTDHLPILTLIGWIGAAATIVGAFLALSQDDAKRMFAYSGISHIGLIVMGISMGNETGFVGGIFYLINDAVMQAVLFFVAGAAIYRYGARDLADYFQLRGQMPWTVGALIVAALSMIGIPPTGGFFGKWYILLGALEAENYVAVGAIVGVTLLTMAYFIKVIEKIFHHSPQVPDRPDVETPLAMRFSMGALSLTIIGLGLMSDRIIRMLSDSAVPLGL